MRMINTKHVFIVSAALYAISLTQNCFYLDFKNPKELAPGYLLLLAGWMGFFYGCYVWLANPLLFVAWLFIVKKIHIFIDFVINFIFLYAKFSFL